MQIWAHRGISALAPENTMEAFAPAAEAAAKGLVTGIETDVHLTTDGVPVICHDEDIARTSNGTGLIADMTLEELRRYDYSHVEGKDFASFGPCAIPTLDELLAFAAAAPTPFRLNLELKTDENPYPGIEEKVAAAVRAAGLTDRVVISSFNAASLDRMKAVAPELPVGFLYYKPPAGLLKDIKAGRWQALHPRYSCANRLVVRAAHKAGLPVRCYTVDDPALAARLVRRGVDEVFSNNPAGLQALL